MSSLTLERARANHEDIEAYERAIVAILEDKPRTNKERVWQQHRIANLIEQIRRRAEDLEAIYEDKDGLMKEEVATLRGREAFPNFYERLEQAKEYHQRFPNLPVKHHPSVHEESEPRVAFSGEEVFGKYLDLQALHAQFLALPQTADKIDYQTYLEGFAQFDAVPPQRKNATYTKYVRALNDYLEGFLRRTQPLVNLEAEVVGPEAEGKFERLWREGRVPGWPLEATGLAQQGEEGAAGAPRPVDLKNFHSAEALEALGMERLKEGLMALGMKCGGTLSERASRLFSTKGKAPGQIDKKLLAKPPASKNKPAKQQTAAGAGGENGGGGVSNGANGNGNGRADPRRTCAWLEHRVGLLSEALGDVVGATRKFAEKKQTRTQAELAAELREEEEGVVVAGGGGVGGGDGRGGAGGGGGEGEGEDDDDEDDEDGPIYNPLNLPLGYDGKPIPYWLYKLHGLSVEYKCEICGNYSYWGRRAFDRHFQEWRHAHGMRCLKIPNTKHFHDITTIADAQALYARIKDTLKQEQYDAEKEEEFEDSEGNVLDRRTFEDLARQGLL